MMHHRFLEEFSRNVFVASLQVCSVSVISMFFITQARANPIPRWMQPCRGSLDSNRELTLPILQNILISDTELARQLGIKAGHVEDKATSVKDQMADERIQSTDLQEFLDENTTLPGFPDHRALNTRTRFISRLREDYRRVAVTAIFVEEMLTDEERSVYSPSYTRHFRHIESKIYPLLCQLKMAILNKGAQLPHVSNDVMHTSLRNVDTHALRHMRDYRILKDIVRLYRSIQTDYGNIHAEERVNVQVENR